MVEQEKCPTQAEIFTKIAQLTLALDPEFIKTCWKMCGLASVTNTPDESEQIASAISNMNLAEDDEYELCEEDDREQEDDLIELVPIPTESTVAAPAPERKENRKIKQQPITNYFKPKREKN